MSTGAFSLDQLMELAGLAVSQAGKLRQPGGVLHKPWRLLQHFGCFTMLMKACYDIRPTNITQCTVFSLSKMVAEF